jgi:hypothetical protein
MTTRLASGTTHFTVAMHTERQALSTYSGFAFNSFATFNGVALGASATGLHALTGTTDAGVAISAVVKTGINDFGTSLQKTVDQVYVGCKSPSNMQLKTVTDEVTTLTYTLPSSASTAHATRVTPAKGNAARYWQFEISNVAGADFTIDSIEVKPTILKRRVRGRSA